MVPHNIYAAEQKQAFYIIVQLNHIFNNKNNSKQRHQQLDIKANEMFPKIIVVFPAYIVLEIIIVCYTDHLFHYLLLICTSNVQD